MVLLLAGDAVLYISIAGKVQTIQGINNSKPAEPIWPAKNQRRKDSVAVLEFAYMFDSGTFCVNHPERRCQIRHLALKV